MSDSVDCGYSRKKVIKYLRYFKNLLDKKINCYVSKDEVLALWDAYNILKSADNYSSDVVISALNVFENFERHNNFSRKRYNYYNNSKFNSKPKKRSN